jgi:type III secretion protein W
VPDGAGAWRGQAVRETPSEESLVMDALEEIGDDFSDDMEAEFQKREVEEGHLADIIDRILGVESVANMLDNLTDLRQADLRRLLAMVLRQRFASPEQLRAFVRERFKDPTHQHAALKTLVEVLRRGGADPRRVAAAEQALRGLEQEAGPQIRAGSNIAGVADAFAGGDAARIGELRGTYRDAVLGYAGMTETFRGLLDKYGTDGLAQALRFLSAALGADLAAAGPSLDKARLQAIVEDIYRLEVLGGLAGECNAVMRHFDTPGRPCRGADLLEQVVGLMQDKWPTADKIGRLPPALCANTTDREILFLRELHELLRLIPVKAYTDDEQRPRLLDAAQGALDTAIEKEDEDDEA